MKGWWNWSGLWQAHPLMPCQNTAGSSVRLVCPYRPGIQESGSSEPARPAVFSI